MPISITVDPGRLPQQLRRLEGVVRTAWWRRYAPTAVILIEREQRRHFAAQSGPNGEKWAPLSPLTLELSQARANAAVGGKGKFSYTKSGTLRVRGKGGEQATATVRRTGRSRILTDTGKLMASVTGGGGDSVKRVGPHDLVVGTRAKYAKRLHFGGTFPTTPRQRGYLGHLLGRWFPVMSITTPARPFLGMGAAGREDLKRAARSSLNNLLRDAAR